jgi:hypothetical protein
MKRRLGDMRTMDGLFSRLTSGYETKTRAFGKNNHIFSFHIIRIGHKTTRPKILLLSRVKITKQTSYVSTNIEQEPQRNQSHQQTGNIQKFKSMMKRLFEQMGTRLNLLTTVLKSYNSPCGTPTAWQHTEEPKIFISIHNTDIMIISIRKELGITVTKM